jgi:hypothetical protein
MNIHLTRFNPEDGRSIILPHFDILLQDGMMSQHRKPQSE